MWEDNGKTNESRFVIMVQNGEERPRNNRYLGSFVGTVWAEVVDDVKDETLQPLISRKVSTGSTLCSDTWKAYTGIATRGYVHRLVNHGERQYSDGTGNHINGLEGFWGFLKRKLASKGGITKQKFPLYLAEYVWRYDYRNDSDRIKMR